MVRLQWGALPPMYDNGVDQGVLYLDDGAHPWNGLVSVDERDTSTIETEHYFDGNRLHISQELGDFEGTIEAYTYPDVFAEYNGWGEKEEYKRFGFSYRTQYGQNHKIHLVYNVLVRDDSRTWTTSSDKPNPSTFRWDIYGSAVPIPGASPASRLVLETPSDASVITELEDILYGTSETEPRLPSPEEIVELYESRTTLRITQHGNGTWTAEGPDDMVWVLPDGRFEINSPSAFLMKEGRFVVNSF